MLLYVQLLAEERIKRAQREGQFDNLEGAGRPLVKDEAANLPDEIRIPYRFLKSAGCLPPELEAERDIQNAIDLLEYMEDEQERYQQMQKLNLMISKLGAMRNRPVYLENELYYNRIVEKVKVHGKKTTGKRAE